MKTKKLLCVGLVILFALSAVFVGMGSLLSTVAFAQTAPVLTAEQYTNSDYLLYDNGTESTYETIQSFAKGLADANVGTSANDITMVIPSQYLETVNDQTFYYCGKEYGFFLVKNGDIFDLLLIDFVFEFDREDTSNNQEPLNNEYKMEIKPILQQSFKRTGVDGDYDWTVYNTGYKYYVANPAFATTLLNENALNFGDEGYDKQTDDGLIIQQSRINFGKVDYKSNEDFVADATKLLATFALDCSFYVADCFTYGMASQIRGYVDKALEYGELIGNLMDGSEEKVIEANHENYILTQQSKASQKTNAKFKSYSRSVSNYIKGEVILSDDNNSYMESIVLLNDTNYRSRLIQMCDFEIVKRYQGYDTPEYVTETTTSGGEENLVLSFNKQRVLFDDYQFIPQFDEACYETGDTISINTLPEGNQTARFVPKYSGEYSFDFPSIVTATIGENEISAGEPIQLTGGQEYLLVFTNPSEINRSIFDVNCELQSTLSWEENSIIIQSGQETVFSIVPEETGYFLINVDNERVELLKKIDNDSVELLEETKIDNNTYYTYLEEGQIVYLIFYNDFSIPEETVVTISQPQELEPISNLPIGANIYSFTNENNKTLTFELIVNKWRTGNWLDIVNTAGQSIGNQLIEGEKITYLFQLAPNETCFVKTRMSNELECTLGVSGELLMWMVDNEPVAGTDVTLSRGEIYSISLMVVEDDSTYNSNTAFVPVSDSANYSLSSNELDIYYSFPTTEMIHIMPIYAPQFSLTIKVGKGKEGEVVFDKDDGAGGSSSVYAYYGNYLPKVAIPNKLGYDFIGYFTERNGAGTQYYDELGRPIKVSDFTSDVTLYACWEAVYFTVTFDYWSIGYSKEIQVLRDHPFPSRLTENEYWNAPEREGYEFVGYFSAPNGQGTKYYKMDVLDDRQSADIYGYDHYYVEKTIPLDGKKVTSDITLYAHWKIMYCRVALNCIAEGEEKPIAYKYVDMTYGDTISITADNIEGYTFKCFALDLKTYDSQTFSYKCKLTRSTYSGKIVLAQSLSIVYTKACVAEGSLITLADGRQVPVESLTGDEMLLVWNMYTGTFDSAPILFIDSDPAQMYEVVNLHFSDGTVVKVISEHAFWDFDLNRYVYLRSDARQYIGHWFNKQITDSDGNLDWTRVQLVDVDVQSEYTSAWSPVTYSHLCYYVNGMLSIPGGITGLFNIFEVDSETMMFDAEQMATDIAQYGLFTYEEFAELVPVSEEVFDAFNAQYFKVAIGKGLIDIEGIAKLAADYAEFF